MSTASAEVRESGTALQPSRALPDPAVTPPGAVIDVPVKKNDKRSDAPTSPLQRGRRKLFVPFVGPAFFLYAVAIVAPTLFTVVLSFSKWAGSGPIEWVGFDNYKRLWYDDVFASSFGNTLLILFGVGFGTFLLSFFFTTVLREMAGRKFVRAVIFFPNAVSALAISILWGFLFQADGLINKVMGALGLDAPPRWLADDNLFYVICIGLIWINTGFYTTILMAAVDRIPITLYEAADLEGANAWQKFRHVTLPMMWDAVAVSATLWVISAIKIFEFIYVFAGAAGSTPTTKAWTLSLYAYAEAFQPTGVARFGASAAATVVTLVLIVLLIVLTRRVTRRESLEF
ncbi:glycerol-3-phosphate ABC transporter permease [Streptomyces spiroverticillatus]|uniref:Glycerol-3-phosphate ABC transporter permease n=1 Tax=Streptomyces finlayi TaxID=67296 RepID=A0A918X3T5_9ACTN|nr:sugar ABC transporter permease [Streptomyces finlayi]GHA28595.1 glycerol-3-phosphate ABC transporter permease [Streptomyces spiroverticillatus]GHD09263.1 glycerol-3-phosphate ABC transporter permease [Streptomyces finlayi]